jgi:excisionase family DNA binding protein
MTEQATESQRSRGLTVTEACDQLGIKKTKFYDLIRKGELEAVDINGVQKRNVGQPGRRRSLRVDQAEIDRFKRERLVTA